MEWRDFMRGFFGHRGGPSDQWPPPPPIPEFNREENAHGSRNDVGGDTQSNFGGTRGRDEDFFWGRRNHRPSGHDEEELFEDFGNRFVFSNLFSAMGEMFQEMERSMRDMDSFFGNTKIEDHSGMIPFHAQITPLPRTPDLQGSPSRAPPKEDNLRDLVLKDSDTPPSAEHHNSKHYIPEPDNSSDKVDRDLDELYQKSLLDLSDLPIPSTSDQSHNQQSSSQSSMVPFDFHKGQRSGSSFQKTYQTFSFNNGRWEGEIVKEDQKGKEITRYYQDKDGQRHETTEYFPRDGCSSSSSNHHRTVIDSDTTTDIFTPSYEPPRLFQFFDRFFKPRM